MMEKAVFLDRDGVLTELVLNPKTGEYEGPHSVSDLKLLPDTIEPLKKLSSLGYYLFLVSNQPDYAKGKVDLQTLLDIGAEFEKIIKSNNIAFKEYYYCYHHPKGVVPEYSYECECRKPKSFFLRKAASDYKIDLKESWMIGDRDIDIECGNSVGAKTILVEYLFSKKNQGKSNPNFRAKNLSEAVKRIS